MIRRAGAIVAGLFATVIGLLALCWVLTFVRERDDAVPPNLRLIPTALGRVAVAETGPAGGPPVLLIHGTAAWSGFWREVAAHLAAEGWRVVAVDVPPFGYSDHDPQARYDRISQARRLADVIRAAGGGHAAVVAHSFGAGAAVELALRDRALVEQLVLVDPALGVSDAPPQGAGMLGQPLITHPLVAATLTNPLALTPLMRTLLVRKGAAADWRDTLRQPMRRPGTTAAYARWLPALFASDDGALSRTSAGLRALKPPLALIWGEADSVTPLAQGRALARLVRPRAFLGLRGDRAHSARRSAGGVLCGAGSGPGASRRCRRDGCGNRRGHLRAIAERGGPTRGPGDVGNQIERASLRLDVEPAKIFADHAEHEHLDRAQHDDDEHRRGPALYRLALEIGPR